MSSVSSSEGDFPQTDPGPHLERVRAAVAESVRSAGGQAVSSNAQFPNPGNAGIDETANERQARHGHWLIMDSRRWITGCHCGFRSDVEQEAGYGDDVVEHLRDTGWAEGYAAGWDRGFDAGADRPIDEEGGAA